MTADAVCNKLYGVHSAILALATTAFFGQIRLGELFPDTQNIWKFKGKYNLVLKDLAQPHSAHGSRKLHLPWTKTKKNQGEDVILCKQNGTADPINAMLHHIHKNRLSENSPIASYIAPNAKQFLKRCNEICGTTFFLIKGVNPDVVKALGRWSSDAFKKYWCNLEILGVLHIELLDTTEKKKKVRIAV
ncbi:hypothetical protein EV421DRAFT_1852992 [Armillaria borealis]|uniref:Ndc10 domain-containing protein n=1 Tax=Armillaria borealis TaxID=47425 RepID=A0AA39ME77_9AGAR|nr:hypothetical protein EV421DRAFT_1852992 [Armillaria borealis]